MEEDLEILKERMLTYSRGYKETFIKYMKLLNFVEQLEATPSDDNTSDKIREYMVSNKLWKPIKKEA